MIKIYARGTECVVICCVAVVMGASVIAVACERGILIISWSERRLGNAIFRTICWDGCINSSPMSGGWLNCIENSWGWLAGPGQLLCLHSDFCFCPSCQSDVPWHCGTVLLSLLCLVRVYRAPIWWDFRCGCESCPPRAWHLPCRSRSSYWSIFRRWWRSR